MSRIDELIEELCPDGVEFHTLGELEAAGIVCLGRGAVISKRDIAETPGDYPVYSSSASGLGEFGRYGKYMFDDERITWSVDGGGRFFYRPRHKYSVTNVSGWMTVESPSALPKYLYYVLAAAWSKQIFDYTRKAHPSVIREVYRIPVPPLEVQREIVRVLDQFTQLEAELEARRRQYEHYRDQLLTFPEAGGVRWVPMGEVVSILHGFAFKSSGYSPTGVRVIRISDVQKGYLSSKDLRFYPVNRSRDLDRYRLDAGDLVISLSGSVGRVAMLQRLDLPAALNQRVACLRLRSPEVDTRYMFHLLNQDRFEHDAIASTSGGTVKNVSTGWLLRYPIPIPDLEQQRQIATTLDKFDAIVNDLSIGLPAELAARRKQYEYYRDKLLTFKEAV